MKTRGFEKRSVVLPSVVVVILLLIGVIPLQVTADDPIQVYVNPVSKTITAGQTFTITIACTPGQLIKSYELQILFNPIYLIANSVTKGNIFNGYETFFNAGTIDNTAGTIVDIYGLIVGNGLVSTPGSLISLSFTAKLTSGPSTIGLLGVGVTNETAYVPITVTNGTVTLREYTLSVTINGLGSVIKNPNRTMYAYGNVVQLTAIADTGSMFTSWGGNLSRSTNPTTITMNGNKSVTAYFTQNQYVLTMTTEGSGSVTKNPNQVSYSYGQVVTVTAVSGVGYQFNSWSGDLTGIENPKTITMNGNKAITAHFQDAAPPQISGIAKTTSNPVDTNPAYGWVNVTCTVTDNIAVSQVILQIHTPRNSWNNVSMIAKGSGQYYYRSTNVFTIAGNYSYSIRAQDVNSNANSSSNVLFSMPANWDINNNGTGGILDLVLIANHYGEQGLQGWIREDVDNNGVIQVLDLVYISNHFRESWWE